MSLFATKPIETNIAEAEKTGSHTFKRHYHYGQLRCSMHLFVRLFAWIITGVLVGGRRIGRIDRPDTYVFRQPQRRPHALRYDACSGLFRPGICDAATMVDGRPDRFDY